MKTLKIILCIAAFWLTPVCLNQLFSQNNSDILYYTAFYNTGKDRVIHQVSALPDSFNSGDQVGAPVVLRSYFVPVENMIYEEDVRLESWMSSPFENTFVEGDMPVESWMTSPFESSYQEPDLVLESWMFSPFENSYREPELVLESWMTHPWI